MSAASVRGVPRYARIGSTPLPRKADRTARAAMRHGRQHRRFFRAASGATRGQVLYRHFADAQWRDVTAGELATGIARWQAAFRREGLAAGDRVALCARNGVDWVAIDLAALGLALVVVPLYVDDNPDNVAWCVAECRGETRSSSRTRGLPRRLRKAGAACARAAGWSCCAPTSAGAPTDGAAPTRFLPRMAATSSSRSCRRRRWRRSATRREPRAGRKA